jgi:hypothetical protein
VAEQHSAVKNAAWMRNPVNAFITAELDKQKLAALPDVDRQTLLRRVYLHLTGVPPMREEIAAVQIALLTAYETAVDRLQDAVDHTGLVWTKKLMIPGRNRLEIDPGTQRDYCQAVSCELRGCGDPSSLATSAMIPRR